MVTPTWLGSSSSSMVQSLLPLHPRSPPAYSDLYSKLWEMAKVQVLKKTLQILFSVQGF